jgi:RNA polymerase sigma-70 factor (ECF subfamily)
VREETLVTHILRHKRVLTGMITALVGDVNVAEDLFQETAVILTRKREEADEDTPFVAWARKIALNVVRDYRKKNARRNKKLRCFDDETLEAVAAVFEETEEPLWDVRREALRKCAQSLPERERAVIRRRYEGEEPIETLAGSLGMSRGAVDTLLYRIRKALHACVEGRIRGLGLS